MDVDGEAGLRGGGEGGRGKLAGLSLKKSVRKR